MFVLSYLLATVSVVVCIFYFVRFDNKDKNELRIRTRLRIFGVGELPNVRTLPCGDATCDCEWTSKPEMFNKSDIAFYDSAVTTIGTPPVKPLPILFNLEAYERFPEYIQYLPLYPIRFTYRQSDAFTEYYYNYYGWYDYFQDNVPPRAVSPNAQPAASYIASNCESVPSRRQEWVSEFAKYFEVHSYGGCLKNKEWPMKGPTRWFRSGSMAAKIDVMKNYKLHFAFENTIEADYVSEKVYSALVSGTLPVYLGAPNIKEFIPHPMSVIDINSFATKDDAFMYVKEVLNNQTLYDRHHEWRKHRLPKWFLEKFQRAGGSRECRLCNHFCTAENLAKWT